LIIEIDGGHHRKITIKENDEQRTQYIKAKGYRIIRFWNGEVLNNIEGVLKKITIELKSINPHLTSPLEREKKHASASSPPRGGED
jgi:very-short-patch-repair endonuclease